MLHAAKLLHSRGFHVTFVNTDYNHKRLLKSWAAAASSSSFPPSRDLVHKLNDCVALPRVSCILSDAAMAFTLDVARELRIPDALFLTPSACANLAFLSYPVLVEAGLVPLKSTTNCFYACKVWEVGIEIGSEVKKEEVEKLVREVMDGEKGNEMKMKAMEWKLKAEESTKPGGSSFQNLNKLIEILLKNTTN
ncbi:7-deoxyloganetin glucosyltransferase [Linum grandiflorum]